MSSKGIVPNPVPKLYYDVIDDVIGAVRDAVLDEGIDEAVLGDLKTLWKKKLDESRALEGPHQDQQVMYVYMKDGQETHAPYRPDHPGNRVVPFRPNRPVHSHMGPPGRVMPMGMSPHGPVHMGGHIGGLNGPGPPHFGGTQRPPAHLHTPRHNHHLPPTPHLPPHHDRSMLVRKPPTHPSLMQPPRNLQRLVPPHHLQHHSAQVSHPSVITQNHFQYKQIDGAYHIETDSDSDADSSSASESEATRAAPNQNQEDAESLNSADDVSESNDNEVFDTENIVICQFDKIQRVRNKWRFHLKDGIMSLNGKDYVFQKATGDGEW